MEVGPGLSHPVPALWTVGVLGIERAATPRAHPGDMRRRKLPALREIRNMTDHLRLGSPPSANYHHNHKYYDDNDHDSPDEQAQEHCVEYVIAALEAGGLK